MNSQSKYRIAIAGIGGVGGYVGGLLASKYRGNDTVEIIFIARGPNEKIIREKGLKLITANDEMIVYPHLVSHDAQEIGQVDVLICAVKSYDLVDTIEQLRQCLSVSTIILPLENRVDAKDKIKSIVPHTDVIEGCIYLNSRLQEPGVVKQMGSIHSLYFGSDRLKKEVLNKILSTLKHARIDASISDNIQQTVWEKFVFISSIAAATSYSDATIGEVLKNAKTKDLLLALIEEVKAVAMAKGISLPENISQKIIEKASSMPFEATSSLHTDFKMAKRTETESLIGYVVENGKNYGIATPLYQNIYAFLVRPK